MPFNEDGAAGHTAKLGAYWIRDLLDMERRGMDGVPTIDLERD